MSYGDHSRTPLDPTAHTCERARAMKAEKSREFETLCYMELDRGKYSTSSEQRNPNVYSR